MKLRIETVFIRLQLVALVGIGVTQALGQAGLASGVFTLTFGLTLGFWLAMAGKRFSKNDLLAVLILAGSCTAVAVNALATGTLVSFSYIKKLVIFWSAVLLLGAAAEYRPDRTDIRFVFRWNALLACFLIGMYCLQREQMYRINGIVTIYLTFRFTNPNLTAVFLAAICMIELIHGAAAGRKLEKCLHLVLAGILAYFVFETRARNARLLLGFFLLVYGLVSLRPGWKPKVSKGMAALTAVFPLLFAVGYLWFVDAPSVQNLFAFLIGEGKGLDSRLEIWRFALSAFLSSPLTGAYSQISGGTGASQMHNSHLDILASYGLAVFVLVCVLLFRVLRGKQARPGDRIRFLCQMALAALLLSGLGEAMLFSGGMGVYLFAGILLVLANFDFAQEGTAG